MPAGVVLSVRSLRAGTRPLGAGTESVIEVRAALGAFGGERAALFIDLAIERFGHKKKIKRDAVNGFLRSGKGLVARSCNQQNDLG
jgi:hypothetical protein